MNVVGLDLSLRSTGVATPFGSYRLVPPIAAQGIERISWFVENLAAVTGPRDLVVVEGYSYGSSGAHAHELGALGGAVRLDLYRRGVPFADVPPTVLKKYATGKGNASKERVLVEAVKRLGYDGDSNDEADALWLRQMGLARLFNAGVDPTDRSVNVPLGHRGALDAVRWPYVKEAA